MSLLLLANVHPSYGSVPSMMPPDEVRRVARRLIHRSAWNRNSRKFISKILHSLTPVALKTPAPGTLHSPIPVPLVTPMDRYAGLWMRQRRKLKFVVLCAPYVVCV